MNRLLPLSDALRAAGGSVFQDHADLFWDERGPYRALHVLGALRMKWILRFVERMPGASQEKKLHGLKVLDVGCGGGLVSEPCARLGARVTGIDACAENIQVARAHANAQGLRIVYNDLCLDEYVCQARSQSFDVVLAFEVVEHVEAPLKFMRHISSLLRPEGWCILSTLNRTAMSYWQTIVLAESLGWIPRGTHSWSDFLTPDETIQLGHFANLELMGSSGVFFNPIQSTAKLIDSLSVGYMMAFRKL